MGLGRWAIYWGTIWSAGTAFLWMTLFLSGVATLGASAAAWAALGDALGLAIPLGLVAIGFGLAIGRGLERISRPEHVGLCEHDEPRPAATRRG